MEFNETDVNTEEMLVVKRYVSYDTLPVARIILAESNSEDIEGDKDCLRSRFLGMVRGFNRDFLQGSSPPGTIFHGKTVKEVPSKKIKDISSHYVSAFCAPNNCLESVHKDEVSQMQIVEGINAWDQNEDFAYGMATSLYETLPTGQYAGDPLADSLAIVTRENCAILALADGVSWGEKSKLASNCSVYGSTTYLCNNIGDCTTTKDVFRCILKAFENAQARIVEDDATLTTLCVAVVVQLQEKDKWCLCVVNVGDSYAYVYNKHGVIEVTHGSHPIDEARDMRYSGGALGPADGYNPDLANLTCSLVTIDEGDIVFLCSDGVSDNFDPAVAKFIPRFKYSELNSQYSTSDFTVINNMSPHGSFEYSKDAFKSDNRRHRSLGDIYENVPQNSPNIPSHLTDREESPNKVIYFQFNDDNPDDVIESKLVLDYYSNDLNPAIRTKQSMTDQSHIENGSSPLNNCPHTDKIERSCSVDGCKNVSSTDIPNESSINILEIDKQAMLSEGVELTPRERHLGSLEQMKEVINTVEFEPINQGSKIRAVDICAQIMNFVINRTAEKRDILEQHPESEMNEMTSEERKLRNRMIKNKLKDVPGKLDHASIVAYEVGFHYKDSPLKLDYGKSSPKAESLREHKPSKEIKIENPVAVGNKARSNMDTRHYANHGKQAFSHFM